MTALREVSVSIAPTVSLCPNLAPTSHKGHDTYAAGPLCYEQHDKVKLDPRLTEHSCLRSDIREQLRSRVQLSGELAGILKLRPLVLLRVSLTLLCDGRTGERCLYEYNGKYPHAPVGYHFTSGSGRRGAKLFLI